MNIVLRFVFAAAACAFFSGASADAYVEILYPLEQVLRESDVIVEGVIDKADAKTRTGVIKVTRTLKGKCVYTHIRMNFGGGQEYHPEVIMRHIVVGAPALVFYNKTCQAQAYVNRFFFQLYGDAAAAPEKAWWNFTHVEIRMNRTFAGPAQELIKLVTSVLTGKTTPPAPDAKLPNLTKELLLSMPVPSPAVAPGSTKPLATLKATDFGKTSPPDAEGFIRAWLLLGPIPVGEAARKHSDSVQREFFDREWFPADAAPRAGEKVFAAETELEWQAHEAAAPQVDLAAFAKARGKGAEDALYLGVAYIVCDREVTDVRLATGSDNGAVWRLNGKDVTRVYATRTVAKDQDRSDPVKLKKGVNVLSFAVINGDGASGACARFLYRSGTPFKAFQCGLSPGSVPSPTPASK